MQTPHRSCPSSGEGSPRTLAAEATAVCSYTPCRSGHQQAALAPGTQEAAQRVLGPFSLQTRPQHLPLSSTQVNLSGAPGAQPTPPTRPDAARPHHGLRVPADHPHISHQLSTPPPPLQGLIRAVQLDAGWCPPSRACGGGAFCLGGHGLRSKPALLRPQGHPDLWDLKVQLCKMGIKTWLVPWEESVNEPVRAQAAPWVGWLSGCAALLG